MSQTAATPVLDREVRRARPLAAVGKCYLVGRRHMLFEMSDEQQLQIRDVYDETGFVNEQCYSLELFGVYTDLPTAKDEASRYENGFWMELPVGASLGNELKRYRPEGHPSSSSDSWYLETSPGLEFVERQVVVEFATVFSRVMQLASNS